jgi:hypothetical protein
MEERIEINKKNITSTVKACILLENAGCICLNINYRWVSSSEATSLE